MTPFAIEETFRPRPSARWRRIEVGGGRLIVIDGGLRLALAGARRGQYADAQIDDYGRTLARPHGLPRPGFPWRPPVLLLNRLPWLARRIWPRVQRALRIAEAPAPPPDAAWRTYTLEWRAGYARFDVDGATVLETDRPPRGPLGFVAWVDNLWAVATPRGRFGWGLLDAEAQWMDLGLLRIEALSVTQG